MPSWPRSSGGRPIPRSRTTKICWRRSRPIAAMSSTPRRRTSARTSSFPTTRGSSSYERFCAAGAGGGEVPGREGADAAAGGGGDAFRAYASDAGDRSVLVLMTRWDSPRDAFEFVEAFHAYGGWRFGERRTEQTERRWTWHHGSILLERAYDETLW